MTILSLKKKKLTKLLDLDVPCHCRISQQLLNGNRVFFSSNLQRFLNFHVKGMLSVFVIITYVHRKLQTKCDKDFERTEQKMTFSMSKGSREYNPGMSCRRITGSVY